MKKGYQHNYLRPNRYNILGPKFERSNRDRTKLDRDVADIRCACAVRDLGNGGFQRYCGRCTRPRRPRTSPPPRRAAFDNRCSKYEYSRQHQAMYIQCKLTSVLYQPCIYCEVMLWWGCVARGDVWLRIFWRLIHVTKRSRNLTIELLMLLGTWRVLFTATS